MTDNDANDDVGLCRLEISFKENTYVPSSVNLRKVILQNVGPKDLQISGDVLQVIKHFEDCNERIIKSLRCQVNLKPSWILKTLESILSQAGVVYKDDCFCGPKNLNFEGIEQFEKDVENVLANFPTKFQKTCYSNGSNNNKHAFVLECIHLNEEKIYPMFLSNYFKTIASDLIGQINIENKDSMRFFIKQLKALIENIRPDIQSDPVDVDENIWNCVERYNTRTIYETLKELRCTLQIIDGPSGNRQLVISSCNKSGVGQANLDEALSFVINLYQDYAKRGMTATKIPITKLKDFERATKFVNDNNFPSSCSYEIYGLKSKLHDFVATLKDEDRIEGRVKGKLKTIKNNNQIPENEVKATFSFDSGLKIFISKGNLVHQKTSAIVNPANSQLIHGGGAARAIADAGGAMLDEECREFIKDYGQLGVTKVMHTTAGDMRPRIQYVIHTVGPRVSTKQIDAMMKDELHSVMIETFLNCFNHANNVLKISSIALPAISSGIFGVPLDVVASAMFQAANNFHMIRKVKVLEEIHFVNFDDKTVDEILRTFDTWSEGSDVDGNSVGNHHRHKEINKHSFQNIKKDTGSKDLINDIENKVHSSNYRLRDKNEMSACAMSKVAGLESKPAEMKSDQNGGEKDTCAICLDDMKSPEKIKCGHKFCKDCLAYYTENCHNKCPICGVIYGVMKGNQPEGTMQVNNRHYHLSGYEDFGTLEISYFFKDGIQNESHPHPGTLYYGTVRNAFLPDNDEGRQVACMLKEAFDNRLLFTIGRSLTTGYDDRVVWNDIHHKTSNRGGAYGYPDPTYLKRVKEELAHKGIFPKGRIGK